MDANTIRQAKDEILRLRRDNEILGAQVRIVDVFAAALDYRAPSQGYGEDVIAKLDRAIREAEAPPAAGQSEGV